MTRVLWIDVLKGFGILSVVAGHIYGGEITRTIYIFHMPLFFFISGYLFKPTDDYRKYFTKKTAQLLVPYFSFLVLLDSKIIIGFIYNLMNNSMTPDKYLFYKEHFLSLIYGGEGLKGDLGVFWFVTCLFLTQQLFNYLFNNLKKKKLAITMFAVLIISYLESYLFPNLSLPWNANVVLAAIPIFYLGNLFKEKDFYINNTLLYLLGLAVVMFSFLYPENVYNMKSGDYGIPIITLISSLIIIINFQKISIFLSKKHIYYTILSQLGKASMVIMFLHHWLQTRTGLYLSDDCNIRFIISTVGSYLIYLLLSKTRISSVLFLGSNVDLRETSIQKRKH